MKLEFERNMHFVRTCKDEVILLYFICKQFDVRFDQTHKY